MDENTERTCFCLNVLMLRKILKVLLLDLQSHEGYVREMQSYLKHGDWVSNFYGEYQEKKIRSGRM